MPKSVLSYFVLLCLIVSCNSDRELYPSLVSTFADMQTNTEGVPTKLITDEGKQYAISPMNGTLRPDTTYRVVCSYALKDSMATLYELQSAVTLQDSSTTAMHDPTEVYSVWLTKRYLNMQLRPLTQKGTQYWGYQIDSICGKTIYLRLHHNQNNDPMAFSTDVYASLPLEALPQHETLDTLILSIKTTKTIKTWTLKR